MKLSPVILILFLLAGCASAPDPKPEAESQPTIQSQVYDETTPAGKQLSWVLKYLNDSSQTVTVDELNDHFDSTFTAQVPAAQLQQVFGTLALELGPFMITKVKEEQPDAIAVQAKTKTDELWLISLSVGAGKPHSITGLLFQPDPTGNEENLPKTWEDLKAQLNQSASRPMLYVAKIDTSKLGETGQCQPFEAVRGDAQQALGSTFKLYILGALAQQIDEGKLSWDQEVTIKDELKSLPSGVLQNKAAGDKVTIREAANKMISISDNTATDHLLDLVGRDKVEAWVKKSGHSAPERLSPFMSTREMFQIKLGHDEAWRAKYINMNLAERVQALQELKTQPLPALESATGWDKPRDVNTIEWFASGQDLCALHATFISNQDRPAFKTAMDVMSINSGGQGLDPKVWPYVGFKGGSEPGVVLLSFVLQDAKGDWYSVSVGGSDDERLPSTGPYLGFVAAIVKNLLVTP